MRGRRKSGSLAQLERALIRLDTERKAIVAAIHAAVHHLTSGMGEGPVRPAQLIGVEGSPFVRPKGATPKRRKLSKAARAKLAASAKARWAAAKKAGKTKLG